MNEILNPGLEENRLYVRVFGGLELENRWGRVTENLQRPSLSWLLLKYLLVNRGSAVDMVEVLDVLWPGQEEASDALFRVRLRRLREALAPLHLDGKKGLVQFSYGKYYLNPDIELELEEERYTALMERIRGTSLEEPEGLRLCAEALELQRGDFMGQRGEGEWLERFRAYYQREFVSLAHSTLSRTMILGDESTLPLLCRRAADIAPDEEGLNKAIISYLVEHRRELELIRHISRLSRAGKAAAWLEDIK